MINKQTNKQIILDDLNQMFLNRALSSTGGIKDGTPDYVKGYNSGASLRILWKQVVTCSGHSKAVLASKAEGVGSAR